MTQPTKYSGSCGDKNNTLAIHFGHEWVLNMIYTLSNSDYSLTSAKLNYFIESKIFENATDLGKHEAENNLLNVFSVNTGKSYKCYSKTMVILTPNVTVEFRNYQAQAFIKNDTTNVGFDTGMV